ncbi:uncharacterized protein G2W53_012905 [Senna tora]|uniref:Uncharacterized protein n=1 Tax=Senna tora TaxID=362788 RepID=A0A834WQ67_9FABA|nr:uncharacterized protein G2W53_012905 [Senna tora]
MGVIFEKETSFPHKNSNSPLTKCMKEGHCRLTIILPHRKTNLSQRLSQLNDCEEGLMRLELSSSLSSTSQMAAFDASPSDFDAPPYLVCACPTLLQLKMLPFLHTPGITQVTQKPLPSVTNLVERIGGGGAYCWVALEVRQRDGWESFLKQMKQSLLKADVLSSQIMRETNQLTVLANDLRVV